MKQKSNFIKENLKKKTQESKTNSITEEQLEREYKIELFFYNLPILLLVFACVFGVAYIFKKYIEAVTFLTTFFSMRYKFNTTFHYENVLYCLATTIALFTLSVVFSPPITISLFGSVLFGFLDTWASWFIQDRFEHKLSARMFEQKANEYDLQVKELLEKLKKYQNIDLYKMSEAELRAYAQSKGLSEMICDTLVLKVIHNYRWVDIQKERNYTKDGIRYHKEKLIEQLGVDL